MKANVAVHPAEGRREAPLPRIGCNGSLDLTYPFFAAAFLILRSSNGAFDHGVYKFLADQILAG